MFQTALIFTFHQLPSNPLSDLKCPLEVVLEKVQWMAVWHCPLTPCPQAMPDVNHIPIPMFSPRPSCQRSGQSLSASWSLFTKCNLYRFFIPPNTFLCSHFSDHSSCENHPGSTSPPSWSGRYSSGQRITRATPSWSPDFPMKES